MYTINILLIIYLLKTKKNNKINYIFINKYTEK